MEIEQYHRQQRLAATSGNVIAGRSDSYQELENLGNTFTELGIASEKQRLQAQYYDQINNAKLLIARKFEDFQDKLDPNNTDNWLTDLNKMQISYDEVKLSNERAKADFGAILEEEKFNQRKSITDYRRVVDARNFQRNYYTNYKHYMELASKAQTPGEYNQSVLGSLKSLFGLQLKEGATKITPANLEPAEGFDNPLFETEELRKNEAAAWLKDTGEMYHEEQLKNYLNIALSISDGEKYIEILDLIPKEKAKLKSDYLTRKNIENRFQQEKLEKVQSSDKQAILNRFVKRQFVADPANGINEDIDIFINQTSLDPDEKEQWMNKAVNWAKRKQEIQTDPIEEARLEKMALDISIGAMKYEDFSKAVIDAAFGDKPTIDTDAFDSLMSIANREHKSYQANALKEAIGYAETQLITVGQSTLENLFTLAEDETGQAAAELAKNRRKLELDSLSRYRKSLNDWFAGHPDADADQIYNQSRKLLSQYRKMTLEEMRDEQESFEAGLFPEKWFVSPDLKERLAVGEFINPEQREKVAGSAVVTQGGIQIGEFNPDGTVTLNITGLRMLKRATGGDKELARKLIKEKRFVVPVE